MGPMLNLPGGQAQQYGNNLFNLAPNIARSREALNQ
jgi:hypothetical protein